MNEMIGYIFGNLEYHNTNTKNIRKTLVRQSRINKQVAVFVWVTTAYLVLADLRERAQNEKIAQVNKKIEELEHQKGE